MKTIQRFLMGLLVLAGMMTFVVPTKAEVIKERVIVEQQVAVTYHYVYYPDAEVYFVPETRVYWFFEGGTWRSAPAPPSGIVLGASINLDLNDRDPWRHHEIIVKKYGGRHHELKEDRREERREERHEHHDD
jgi:hypothetical protein